MKNRSNLFLVVRNEVAYDEEGAVNGISAAHVVGIYRTPERADELCGQYNQQVEDGKLPREFHFEVQVGTYYDE